MIRTFHSVGQGAFYTEEFENYKFVYDCGSQRKELIIEAIQDFFSKGNDIDAVFISHFHEDHVNGLEFLLQHCNIKQLYLPELHDEEKIYILIQNALYGLNDSFVKKLIQDPDSAINGISPETFTIKVRAPEAYNADRLEQEAEEIIFDHREKSIKSGAKILLPQYNQICDWVFVPFNYLYRQRSEALIKELEKYNLNMFPISNFENEWRNHKDYIVEAYNSIRGNPNTNSMVVYSGPALSSTYNEYLCYMSLSKRPIGLYNAPGCLYFGDYEAKGKRKWDNLFKTYKRYWNAIGFVQIPHHGSRYNYNRQINSQSAKVSIISFGEKNSYRHPHKSTLRDILLDGGFPVLVTERHGSSFSCIIGQRCPIGAPAFKTQQMDEFLSQSLFWF